VRAQTFQLQFDGHQPAQVPVIEQQIKVEVVRTDTDALLPRNEGEACAHFQQKAFHLAQDGRSRSRSL
jgi:hypothetical protein